MKTFAAKKQKLARVMRKPHNNAYHPMDPAQQSQRAEIRRILRSTGAQAKPTIGQPNDKYEQEADRVADQVMAMPDPRLQRQPENEEEEEMVQAKPLADQITPLVQRQVVPEEEEESLQEKSLLQRQPENEEEEEILQPKPLADQITPLVQRQEEPPEEEEEESLQAKESSDSSSQISKSIESKIDTIKGSGQPLPESLRSFYERRFGYDFGDVKLHTDSRASDAAIEVNAKAFTIGQNIVFGEGQYAPESNKGRQLLAHELAHTIQQNSDKQKNAQLRANKINDQIVQRQTPSATGGLPVWNEEEKTIIHQPSPGEFACLYKGLFRGQNIDQKYFIVQWMKGAVGVEYYTCNYAKKYNHQDQPEVDYNFPEWVIDVPSKSSAEYVGLTKRPHIIGFKDKPRVATTGRWPSGAVWKAYMQFRIQVYSREALQGLAVTDFKSVDDPRPAKVVPWIWDDEYKVP